MKTFKKSSLLLLALILTLSSCASKPGEVATNDNGQVEVNSENKDHVSQGQVAEETNNTEEKVHNEEKDSSDKAKENTSEENTETIPEASSDNEDKEGNEGVGGSVEPLEEEPNSNSSGDSSNNSSTGKYSDKVNAEVSQPKTEDTAPVNSEGPGPVQTTNLENVKLGFNNEESRALRDLVESLGNSLVEDDNQEVPTIDNVNDLEAIVAFDNDMSYGWICKYADNKIGVAMIYHEVGQGMSPIVVIFGERTLYESGSSGIMNNDKSRFIQEAEKLKLSFFEPGTNFIDLYK